MSDAAMEVEVVDKEEFFYLKSDENRGTVEVFRLTPQTAGLIQFFKKLEELTGKRLCEPSDVAPTSIMKVLNATPEILEKVIRWCHFHENDPPFTPSPGVGLSDLEDRMHKDLRLDDSDDDKSVEEEEEEEEKEGMGIAKPASLKRKAQPELFSRAAEDDVPKRKVSTTAATEKDASSKNRENDDPDAKARMAKVFAKLMETREDDENDPDAKARMTDAFSTVMEMRVENEKDPDAKAIMAEAMASVVGTTNEREGGQSDRAKVEETGESGGKEEEEQTGYPKSEIRTVVYDESRYQGKPRLFEDEFFDVDNETLFDLLQVANFLMITPLIEEGAKRVAQKITGKTTKGILRVLRF